MTQGELTINIFCYKGKEKEKVVARMTGGKWILDVFLIGRKLNLFTCPGDKDMQWTWHWSWRGWKGMMGLRKES